MRKISATLIIVSILIAFTESAFLVRVNAQGNWTGTEQFQYTESSSYFDGLPLNFADSGSGTFSFAIDQYNAISGTGDIQGSISMTVPGSSTSGASCTGGGTFPYTEQQTISGLVQGSTATLFVGPTSSSAPTTIHFSCQDTAGNSLTQDIPVQSAADTSNCQIALQLVNGYVDKCPLGLVGYEFGGQGQITYTLTSALGPSSPAVDFTWNPVSSVVAGELITFAAAAEPGGAASYTYSWAFSDGGTASGQTASHTFAKPDYYTATVTATSKNGLTAKRTYTVPVYEKPCPSSDYVEGGLVSSPICYPPGMEVVSSGDTSVVDLNGLPVKNQLISGDTVNTENGFFGAKQPCSYGFDRCATAIVFGQGVDSMYPTYCDMTHCESWPQGFPGYGYAQIELAKLAEHFSIDIGAHWSIENYLPKVLKMLPYFETRAVAASELGVALAGLTTIGIASWGLLHFDSTSTIAEPTSPSFNPYENPFASPDVVVQHTKTEFTMSVGLNGTTVMTFSGSVIVASLATNQTVTLNPGQALFVSSNSTLAKAENLTASVSTFNPNTTTHWWNNIQFPAPPCRQTLVGCLPPCCPPPNFWALFVIGGAVLLVAIGIHRRRVKRKKYA